MQARQSKSGGGVIELAIRPLHRVVALLASRGETGVSNGLGRANEIFLVAREARRGGEVVVIIDVAINALSGRDSVSARQRKSHRGVIELCVEPAIRRVTAVAGGGELGGGVIRIAGFLKIGSVAGNAFRRHRLEFAVRCTLMTGVAVHSSVRSGQRKAIVMLLDLLNRDLPSPHGVTLLAIRAQLALVNIRMAILAALADIAEHRLHVTLNASDGLVHAAQGIFSLIVIEFRNGADRSPGARSMAVLTGDIQISVRTVRALIRRRRLCRRASRNAGKREQQCCDQLEYAPSPQHDGPLLSSVQEFEKRVKKTYVGRCNC